MSLTLHHAWDAVCPIKVRMCLHEKKLAFRSVAYEIAAFEHLVPGYLAINPAGVLPALVHDERVVVESSVINEYLDEAFPDPPLKPPGALARAGMRAWVKLQDDVLHPATRPHTFSLMLLDPRSPMMMLSKHEIARRLARHPDPARGEMFRRIGRRPAPPDVLRDAEDALARAFDRIEHGLSDGRPWLAGPDLSLADVAMAGVIDRVEHCALARLWHERPAMAAWVGRLQARPSYRSAIPRLDQRLPGPLSGADR